MEKKEKRPRQWAAEIAELPTLEERRERLKLVPEEQLPLVKTHLKNFWGRKKLNAAQ